MDEGLVAGINFILECNMLSRDSGLGILAFTPQAGVMDRYQTMANTE